MKGGAITIRAQRDDASAVNLAGSYRAWCLAYIDECVGVSMLADERGRMYSVDVCRTYHYAGLGDDNTPEYIELQEMH